MEALAKETWKEIQRVNPDREFAVEIMNMQPAWGDRSLIRQVFANLLSNAAKFTRDRRPAAIEMSSRSHDGEIVYSVAALADSNR